MGGMGNKSTNPQVLLVGHEKTGKSLFLKRILEMKKKTKEDIAIDPTIGFNFGTFSFEESNFDIFDLGGDSISKIYWPTFYRNLQVHRVIYFMNLKDQNSHLSALKEFLVLVNEEELKFANFFIVMNVVLDNNKILDESSIKEYTDRATFLISALKECPIYEFDMRVDWDIIDIKNSNLSEEFLKKCFGKV